MSISGVFNKYKDKIPSWLWLILILLGVLLVIAIPAGFIYLISHFEGIASIIFLMIGWYVFGNFAKSEKRNSFILAGAIGFFALMGMAIDQPGNIIYNQPLALTCPAGTTYSRSVFTRNPLPERTEFVQKFQCFDKNGKSAYTIPVGIVLLTRLGEYILLGYLLLGIRIIIFKLKKKFGKNSDVSS